MYYIGVDIGGMSLKAGVIDENGAIYFKTSRITEPKKPSEDIVSDICALIGATAAGFGVSLSEVCGIGIGIPGSVCDERGVVRYACNINLAGSPIAKLVSENTGVKNVRISNDANCAALAETLFGAGKGAKDTVMITLGTGVGTGIVTDGRLMKGHASAGAEGGHIQINMGGATCGCGKKGHYEAYASATALMNQTRAAIAKYPDSLLAEIAEKEGISGKTAFIAAKQGDKVGVKVVNRYLKYVAEGLVVFANIFAPEKIIIGGGISNEGETVIKPLQRYVSRNIYGARYNPKIRVVAATLKNDAGIIGAAMLCVPTK